MRILCNDRFLRDEVVPVCGRHLEMHGIASYDVVPSFSG